MVPLQSFRAIIELWPTRDAMAADVGAKPASVSKWWQRDSIPADWWSSVTSSSLARRSGVTADVLTRIAAREAA